MTLFEIGFLHVTLIDVVDIAIVSYVLYRLYSVMRRTIAGQIFVGLLLIIAVNFISQTLDMKLLNRLLGTLSEIWVIGLVILFQPELRRILLMIGRNGAFISMDRYDVNVTVDEIIAATEDLALRHFGGLIVVTRTTDLSLTFESGMALNAKLSQEMLVSIFNPRSPLHDGAVVVTGDEIRSARVVLPLSATTRVADTLLGTRHRAGLGISEQADVFVVIVSEESGNVSYAYDGRLYPNQSLDTIRLALLQTLELSLNRRDRRFIRTVVRRFRRRKSQADSGSSTRSRRDGVGADGR